MVQYSTLLWYSKSVWFRPPCLPRLAFVPALSSRCGLRTTIKEFLKIHSLSLPPTSSLVMLVIVVMVVILFMVVVVSMVVMVRTGQDEYRQIWLTDHARALLGRPP